MFRVTLDLTGFERARRDTARVIEHGLRVSVQDAVDAGVRSAKSSNAFRDRSGRLRRSIAPGTTRIRTGAVEQDFVAGGRQAPYAWIVEAGSRAHQIVARRAPQLVFYWERMGRWFFGKTVNHPGTRPHPFMGPAFHKAERVLRARLEGELARLRGIWS